MFCWFPFRDHVAGSKDHTPCINITQNTARRDVGAKLDLFVSEIRTRMTER